MENPPDDYYSILGVNDSSSQDDIKKSYRKLSMKWHPDKNPNNPDAEEKFKTISQAYDIIGDVDKRKEYDFSKKFGFGGGGGGGGMNPDDILNMFFGGGMGGRGGGQGPGPGGGLSGMMGGFPFDMNGDNGSTHEFNMPGGFGNVKIFTSGGPPNMRGGLGGGGGGPFNSFPMRQRKKPNPIIKNITIDINEAYEGVNIPIEIERTIEEQKQIRQEKETIYVDIPQGVDNNEIILIKDKGNITFDDTKGDIKVFITITNTTPIQRQGLNLILNKSITLKEALCGFSFDLKFITGKIFKINNNTDIIQPNYKKVIKNMGMKRGNKVGDFIIIFTIQFPAKLDKEIIDKLKDLL